MNRFKWIAVVIVTALSMTMGFVVWAGPANAVGGECRSRLQEKEVTGLNEFRARARCTSLDGDSKARPKLVRNSGPDYYGPYFTTLNKWYYTDWYTCAAGCHDAYEVAHV